MLIQTPLSLPGRNRTYCAINPQLPYADYHQGLQVMMGVTATSVSMKTESKGKDSRTSSGSAPSDTRP